MCCLLEVPTLEVNAPPPPQLKNASYAPGQYLKYVVCMDFHSISYARIRIVHDYRIVPKEFWDNELQIDAGIRENSSLLWALKRG